MKQYITVSGIFFIFWLLGCSKSSSEEACVAAGVTSDTASAAPCVGEGRIRITNPLGSGYQYSINGGPFQSLPDFIGLRPQSYTIRVKDSKACITTQTVVVPESTPGPLFTAVKNLLAVHCTGCHSGNNPQAGVNLASNCDILQYWDRIKARAVDGIPSPMPQGGLLPQSDRNIIVRWINAGRLYGN